MLELKEGDLAARSDAWIAAKVQTALLIRRNVDASAIQVSVKEGIMTLRGDAISQAQRGMATQYAGVGEGVNGVNNQMSIGE